MMEYSILTCWYKLTSEYDQPGSGPYSKIVTRMLSEGWMFKGELRSQIHPQEGKVYISLVQEFIRPIMEEKEEQDV